MGKHKILGAYDIFADFLVNVITKKSDEDRDDSLNIKGLIKSNYCLYELVHQCFKSVSMDLYQRFWRHFYIIADKVYPLRAKTKD